MLHKIIVIVFGFIVITNIIMPVNGDAETLDEKIDSRAFSILNGTITHVRDRDAFELNGIPVCFFALETCDDCCADGLKFVHVY